MESFVNRQTSLNTNKKMVNIYLNNFRIAYESEKTNSITRVNWASGKKDTGFHYATMTILQCLER